MLPKGALSIAARESRSGFRGMRLMLIALMLGVAVITAIGVLRDALFAGIERDARTIVGGEIAINRPYRPASEDELAFLSNAGEVSAVTEMRAMAATRGDKEPKSRLVELKGVDDAYPLYGKPSLQPMQKLPQALARNGDTYGAAVDKAVLEIFNIRVGDVLEVGQLRLRIMAELVKEPDRVINTYQLGPRILVSSEAFKATGLTGEGSLVTYRYRVKLHEGQSPAALQARIEQAFPQGGWRFTEFREAAPRLKELLERLQHYITLIGLAVLVTAGVGIANSVHAWLKAKQNTVATLKCLGATRSTIYTAYSLQLAVISSLAVLLGLWLGIYAPRILIDGASDILPVEPLWRSTPGLYAIAGCFGLTVVAAFSFWPLYVAANARPAHVFRQLDSGKNARFRLWHGVAYALLIAAMVALAAALTGGLPLTLSFAAGVLGAIAALAAVSTAVRWVATKWRPPVGVGSWAMALRYAMGNMRRAGAPTSAVLLSLGMGTALMVAVVLVEHAMSRQLGDGVPREAPAFFFLDIPAAQKDDLVKDLKTIEGVGEFIAYPTIRGGVTSVKNVPAEKADITPDTRWAVRGDRALSFSVEPPAENPIIAGKWWHKDYKGAPLVSITQDVAAGMKLKPGDYLGFEVMGQNITAQVASVREVDWRNYRMNFAFIFSPGVLESLPYSYLATLEAEPESEGKVLRMMGERHGQIAAVRLREALADAEKLVSQIAAVVELVAGFALVVGTLVIATAVGATQERRIFDHTMLKVMGATRGLILRILGLEFTFLGVSAAMAAIGLGALAAYVMTSFVLKTPFYAPPSLLLGTVGLGALAMVTLGLLSTIKSLQIRPMLVLRNE